MAIQHLRKFISLFYKNYSNKPIVIFEAFNTILLRAKQIVKPKKQKSDQLGKQTVTPMVLKQKQDQLANNINK